MRIHYSFSDLTDYVMLSPNFNVVSSSKEVRRITPHCVVGHITAKSLGEVFKSERKQVSSNYGIDDKGTIGGYVYEYYRSWCSSSKENDEISITIECASDLTSPYKMSKTVFDTLCILSADIAKRHGFKKIKYLGSLKKTIKYEKKHPHVMTVTLHRWFASKSCPGDWFVKNIHRYVKKTNNIIKKGVK